MAEPTLKAYNPTWRDKLGGLLMGDGRASPERRNFVQGLLGSSGLGNTGMGLLDFTPAGNVMGAQESAQKGDYKGAAMNAMFLGPAARTADHVALATAQRMAEQGADRAAIHAQTGWFTGADGKWRFEIPDNNLAPSNVQKLDGFMLGNEKASDVINHPALFDAYPGMNNIPVNELPSGGPNGYFRDSPRNIGITQNAARNNSTPLHEMQHAVQQQEGFATGGDPAYLAKQMPDPQAINDARVLAAFQAKGSEYPTSDFLNTLGRDPHPVARSLFEQNSREELHAMPSDPMDYYKRLAGEVEARNVQTRMNMPPEERLAKPPWETQDVPDNMQILRGLGQ